MERARRYYELSMKRQPSALTESLTRDELKKRLQTFSNELSKKSGNKGGSRRSRCTRGSRRSKSRKTCRKTKRKCSRGSRRSKSGKTCRHYRKTHKSKKSRKTRSAAKRRRSLRGAKKRRCKSGSRRSKSGKTCRKYKNHKHKHTTEHKHKHSRFSTIKKRHQKGGFDEKDEAILEKLEKVMLAAKKKYEDSLKFSQTDPGSIRRRKNAEREYEKAKIAYNAKLTEKMQSAAGGGGTRKRTKKYSKRSHKKSGKNSMRITGGACKKQTTKKYLERASPAYPANDPDCQGKIKTRDGVKYKSVPNKNGVYRWVKM